MAVNFGIKYSRPPSIVLPMVCGGWGWGGVFASLADGLRGTEGPKTLRAWEGRSLPKASSSEAG